MVNLLIVNQVNHIYIYIFPYVSNMFPYFHIFSHMFPYVSLFSHIFSPYFHIFSHILTYFYYMFPYFSMFTPQPPPPKTPFRTATGPRRAPMISGELSQVTLPGPHQGLLRVPRCFVMTCWRWKWCKVVPPPNYKWAIIPLTIDMSPINHSYGTYKPT